MTAPATIPDPTLLPALRTSPKYIFFTDYDGTITLEDSNDFMTDNLGFGHEQRIACNKEVLSGKVAFRDSFRKMLDSVSAPLPECLDLVLKNIKLDPCFKEFWGWCRQNNIPLVVLSGGMKPIITTLLSALLKEDDGGDGGMSEIQIVSNDVRARPGKSMDEEKGWEIVFHDDSHFGHDKSLEIRKYSLLPPDQRPVLFYAGDGVSDLSAARETDVMFAKEGKDLVTYCEKENVPFTTFKDFSDIHKVVSGVVSGRLTLAEAASGRA